MPSCGKGCCSESVTFKLGSEVGEELDRRKQERVGHEHCREKCLVVLSCEGPKTNWCCCRDSQFVLWGKVHQMRGLIAQGEPDNSETTCKVLRSGVTVMCVLFERVFCIIWNRFLEGKSECGEMGQETRRGELG